MGFIIFYISIIRMSKPLGSGIFVILSKYEQQWPHIYHRGAKYIITLKGVKTRCLSFHRELQKQKTKKKKKKGAEESESSDSEGADDLSDEEVDFGDLSEEFGDMMDDDDEDDDDEDGDDDDVGFDEDDIAFSDEGKNSIVTLKLSMH